MTVRGKVLHIQVSNGDVGALDEGLLLVDDLVDTCVGVASGKPSRRESRRIPEITWNIRDSRIFQPGMRDSWIIGYIPVRFQYETAVAT